MRICVVCEKDMEGKPAIPVRDDAVIGLIRSVKRAFGVAQNNELYVCEDDVPRHEKRRKDFERSLVIFGLLAAVVVFVLVASLLLAGTLDIIAFLSAIMVGLFILLFVFVFKYAPALDRGPGTAKARKPELPEELKVLEQEEPSAAKKSEPPGGKKR